MKTDSIQFMAEVVSEASDSIRLMVEAKKNLNRLMIRLESFTSLFESTQVGLFEIKIDSTHDSNSLWKQKFDSIRYQDEHLGTYLCDASI